MVLLKHFQKERLQVDRLRSKLEKNLGSISDMTRLPGAVFIVDTTREHIAVKEAKKLKIPIFAMVDTNCDPRDIDYVIPSNDDASKSISKILDLVSSAVSDGLSQVKLRKKQQTKKMLLKWNKRLKVKSLKLRTRNKKLMEKPRLKTVLKMMKPNLWKTKK